MALASFLKIYLNTESFINIYEEIIKDHGGRLTFFNYLMDKKTHFHSTLLFLSYTKVTDLTSDDENILITSLIELKFPEATLVKDIKKRENIFNNLRTFLIITASPIQDNNDNSKYINITSNL